jgi:hypothetical protein
MKNIILVVLCTLLCTNTIEAQKTNSSKVPATIRSSFQSKFPTATEVKWEIEGKSEYEANFKLNQKPISVNFDLMGKWLETETEIETSALPSAVLATLKKDYADFKIDEASEIENVKDRQTFEVEIEKGKEEYELLFSADGKLLSKTKEK